MTLTLILGGARSGKSTYAVQRAREQGARVLFVATAQAFDDDMRARIDHHQAERPPEWGTLEVPLEVGPALRLALATVAYETIILDCITLLVSNVLLHLPDDSTDDAVMAGVLSETDALLDVIAHSQSQWLVVSNEVGMGVVPPTRLGRAYRDALGRANQRVAQVADEVILMVAGLPWHLKG